MEETGSTNTEAALFSCQTSREQASGFLTKKNKIKINLHDFTNMQYFPDHSSFSFWVYRTPNMTLTWHHFSSWEREIKLFIPGPLRIPSLSTEIRSESKRKCFKKKSWITIIPVKAFCYFSWKEFLFSWVTQLLFSFSLCMTGEDLLTFPGAA